MEQFARSVRQKNFCGVIESSTRKIEGESFVRNGSESCTAKAESIKMLNVSRSRVPRRSLIESSNESTSFLTITLVTYAGKSFSNILKVVSGRYMGAGQSSVFTLILIVGAITNSESLTLSFKSIDVSEQFEKDQICESVT